MRSGRESSQSVSFSFTPSHCPHCFPPVCPSPAFRDFLEKQLEELGKPNATGPDIPGFKSRLPYQGLSLFTSLSFGFSVYKGINSLPFSRLIVKTRINQFLRVLAQDKCPINARNQGRAGQQSATISRPPFQGVKSSAEKQLPSQGPHSFHPFPFRWGHVPSSRQWNMGRGVLPATSRQKDQELGAPSRVSVPLCWPNKEESEIFGGGQRHKRKEPGP